MLLSVTVPGPTCITLPVPLMALPNVTALGSAKARLALSVTAPLPSVPIVAAGAPAACPPSCSVPAEMVVPPE